MCSAVCSLCFTDKKGLQQMQGYRRTQEETAAATVEGKIS